MRLRAFTTLLFSVLFGATLISCGGGATSVSTPAPSNTTPPSIATQPTTATVTPGETATFTVVATGTAPLSYQWQENNTAIAGAISATYTTPATTAADNGSQFRVAVSNSAGGVTSNAATLTVNAVGSCSTTAVRSSSGIDVSLDSCGAYQIIEPSFAWTFGGNLGQTPTNIVVNMGTDDVGAYSEIDFNYSQGGQRTGGIRVYQNELTVLFKIDYVQAANNSSPFPALDTYPQKFQHLAYQGTFGLFTFSSLASDSPWIFFDSSGNTFVLSPASDFMVASTAQGTGGSISSGISSQITSLPAGFSYQTLLVMGKGIDSTYETWGQAMTKLQGKVRPANDADQSLKYLGYWTDNGATYYYKFDSTKGSYEQTLLGVRDNFTQQGLKLGYMQLDSWFYPKGATADWQKYGGIYEYVA